jgi:hypothetical protein
MNRLLLLLLLYAWFTISTVQAEHPHLFFDEGKIAELQQRAAAADADDNDFYADLFREILIDCRSTYGPGKTVPNPGLPRNYQAIVSHGALLLLDPTGLAADLTYQSNTRFFDYYFAVLNHSGWSNFFGNDPFDSTPLLQALCIGYDWHYARFTPNQRADIVAKLTARADYLLNRASTFFEVPSGLGDPENGYLHTFKVLRNRDKIPMSALAVVAYTLEGEVDEGKRQQWLAKVNELMGIWDTYVAHDGMSHEGFSYHEYLMQSWFPMLLIRSRKEGVNQFQALEYIRNHPIYSIYSWVPGGDRPFLLPVPFGDVDPAPPAEVRSLDALAAAMLKGAPDGRDKLANWMQFKPLGGTANNNYSRVDPTQFFWADSSIEMKSPQELGLPRFHYYPERGGFVWRSGWDDMATYFAMNCGPTIGGHQQPENGNFTIFKGGSPFVGHNGRALLRRTEHFNVMMLGNQGQFGDRYQDGSGTTEPQPENRWASIDRLVADDEYFNIDCNLRPNYRESNLNAYHREFLGFGGYVFVRDSVRSNASVKMDAYLHAYSTAHPVSPPDPFTALDIDSNPTVNPWGGSGRLRSITPRTSGPFTGSLTVQDLSNADWTGTVSNSMVLMTSSTPIRRGSKLVRTMTANSGDSLLAFYFPQGDQVEVWPDAAQAEGALVTRGGADHLMVAWPADGTMDNSHEMTVHGAMGGIAVESGAYWGRDLTRLSRMGADYVLSDQPVSVFSTGAGRFRLQSSQTANLSLRHPQPVAEVYLDGALVPDNQWQWANETLTLLLAPSSAQGELTTVIGPSVTAQDIVDYLLGNAAHSPDLDLNEDGTVNIGDVVRATQ